MIFVRVKKNLTKLLYSAIRRSLLADLSVRWIMDKFGTIKELAKEVLIIPTLNGGLDRSLWDRGQRMVRNVDYICGLPEVVDSGLPIDRFCLLSAAYFSDSGLARRFSSAKEMPGLAILSVGGEELLEVSTEVVTERLCGVVEDARIEKINRIITESGDRSSRMQEAMILSDSRNLEDMGAIGIFNELRESIAGGKGVSEVVSSWQSKIDYRYWQARLEKSFRFASVRELAGQRLLTAESFMEQLKIEAEGCDLVGFKS